MQNTETLSNAQLARAYEDALEAKRAAKTWLSQVEAEIGAREFENLWTLEDARKVVGL